MSKIIIKGNLEELHSMNKSSIIEDILFNLGEKYLNKDEDMYVGYKKGTFQVADIYAEQIKKKVDYTSQTYRIEYRIYFKLVKGCPKLELYNNQYPTDFKTEYDKVSVHKILFLNHLPF